MENIKFTLNKTCSVFIANDGRTLWTSMMHFKSAIYDPFMRIDLVLEPGEKIEGITSAGNYTCVLIRKNAWQSTAPQNDEVPDLISSQRILLLKPLTNRDGRILMANRTLMRQKVIDITACLALQPQEWIVGLEGNDECLFFHTTEQAIFKFSVDENLTSSNDIKRREEKPSHIIKRQKLGAGQLSPGERIIKVTGELSSIIVLTSANIFISGLWGLKIFGHVYSHQRATRFYSLNIKRLMRRPGEKLIGVSVSYCTLFLITTHGVLCTGRVFVDPSNSGEGNWLALDLKLNVNERIIKISQSVGSYFMITNQRLLALGCNRAGNLGLLGDLYNTFTEVSLPLMKHERVLDALPFVDHYPSIVLTTKRSYTLNFWRTSFIPLAGSRLPIQIAYPEPDIHKQMTVNPLFRMEI